MLITSNDFLCSSDKLDFLLQSGVSRREARRFSRGGLSGVYARLEVLPVGKLTLLKVKTY